MRTISGDRANFFPRAVLSCDRSEPGSKKHKFGTVNSFIRPAIPRDLAAIMALERDTATAGHWSAEQYESLFHVENSGRFALVIQASSNELQYENDGTILGFIVGRAIGEEWEIENIAVRAAEQRRGLGTRLLKEFLNLAASKGAKTVLLEVRESNRAARGLYQKSSFVEVGRRKKYYRDPDEDAILYRLGLT